MQPDIAKQTRNMQTQNKRKKFSLSAGLLKASLRWGVVPPFPQWAMGREFKGTETRGLTVIGKGTPLMTSISNNQYCVQINIPQEDNQVTYSPYTVYYCTCGERIICQYEGNIQMLSNKNEYFRSDTPVGGRTSTLPNPQFLFCTFISLIPKHTHTHTHTSLGTRPSKNRKGGSGKSAGVEVYTAPSMQAFFRLAFDQHSDVCQLEMLTARELSLRFASFQNAVKPQR